ncbi:PH domain-like protein [Zopfia rhizophila CBS 207.26]|uniref:PH domain-like protein n=1 Tax=Zopfia rhizophila CBS 207.26 TaxID=1314779 RepID=A0A6A6DV60_9PEZI|nr:PH domain-like protein [Zopfia rhizophila CBS 207.26]
MAQLKGKARANALPKQPLPSDYETDAPANIDTPLPPTRTNEELNLKVLRRHYPDVTSVHKVAQYAVLYLFSPETQWEKSGIEGTLFMCELTPSSISADRFSVIILNRRGLNNFTVELTSRDNVEFSEPYVILQEQGEDGTQQIYGLWIFSEPPPSSTATIRVETAEKIQELAARAEESRMAREDILKAEAEAIGEIRPVQGESIPMGRQLSLRELFGQQREQDAAFHIHNNGLDNHHSSRPSSGFAPTPNPGNNDVLGQLFMNAKQAYNDVG